MANILCITLNPAIDLTLQLPILNVGMVNRTHQTTSEPAGKGINVASILSQLGHSVCVTGFLGDDNAQIFLDKFNRLNLLNHCVMVKGATRQNIKIAEQTGQMTDINSTGFAVNDTHKIALTQKINAIVHNFDMVVVSGSLPVGFDSQDFGKLLDNILAINPKLVVDTSGLALKVAIDKQPFLIKPNLDELLQIGISLDMLNTQKLATHSVISLGERGVIWQKPDSNMVANAPKVIVKSTVGAGDTLTAGMIHGLLTLNDDDQILTQAVAMASHAVTIVDFVVADNDQIASLSNHITIKTLANLTDFK